MKKQFLNWSIKRKLLIIILSVTLIALGSFFSILIFNQKNLLYRELSHNVELNAKFIGEYCVSPLEFHDAKGAGELLNKIQKIDYIDNAILFNDELTEFASFNKIEPFKVNPNLLKSYGTKDFEDYLTFVYPISYQNQNYGTLFLKISKNSINQSINNYIWFSSLVLLSVFFISILFAGTFQRVISVPILNLAKLSNKVSIEGNYSLRAEKIGNDEIGALYDSFNNMLTQIQIREIEKNQVLQSLKNREAEKSGILKSAPIGIAFLTNREFKWANDKMAQITGYNSDEIIGTPIEFLYKNIEDFDGIYKLINTKLNNNQVLTIESVWKHKDGRFIDVSLNISAYSESNNLSDVIITAMDVTEIKRNLLALKESEDKFRKLFESLKEGVIILELDSTNESEKNIFKFVDINKSFEELFLCDKIDLISGNYSENNNLAIDYLLSNLSQITSTDENVLHDLYIENLDKYFYCSAIQFKNNLLAIIFFDITEQKQSQQIIQKQITDLEAKNAEMERFTYTVSHDLRSPLITIKGFSGIVKKNIQNEEFGKISPSIHKIESAASKMDELLNDLLELSRIGRMINPASSFSMSEAVQESVELLHGLLTQNNVLININPNMPTIFGDKMRIKEVYQNLIENAVKFAKKDEQCVIDIGYQSIGHNVEFFVKDNGIGVESKYHDNIFGLFNKLSQDTSGSGIGLALIKRIIELHEGNIRIESELSKGACFYFTIKSNRDTRS